MCTKQRAQHAKRPSCCLELDSSTVLSFQAAETDAAVTRLREDMTRLSGCFSNDSDAVSAFRAEVLQALHAAESAVESYERARLRTVSRTGGPAGGLGQQQQGMQLTTPGGAQQGQGGWGQQQQAIVPSPTGQQQQQPQQQQQGALSADVRARLAATGRTSHPSSVLVDAVAKAEETAARCDSQIVELEAVLLRGTSGGSDVANNLGALRASLYDTHAYLLSVAAAVSATHDRVDAAKRACVAQRKATGAGGAGVDPFKTADEDAEREAEAAQRHPQPAFATSPIPASPQQMQQQQQPGASAAMPGMPAMPAPGATGVSWGGLAAGAAPAAQPAGGGLFGATAPQSTPPLFGAPLGAAPPSPVPFAGFAPTPAPFGTAPDMSAAPGAKRTAAPTGGGQPTMQRTRSSSGRR